MIDTLRLTAEAAKAMLERGEASAAELHRAYLDAIGERDGELHAYLTVIDEAVGDGVPIALKDLISTRGVATTAGSRILSGYTPVFDATGRPVYEMNRYEFVPGSHKTVPVEHRPGLSGVVTPRVANRARSFLATASRF